ncbi:MAG: tRNA threonylcarbamoyladenosine dehydratase [Deltaproteobacteria bacterium]|nr:tRNA threonylcarbamoyladenosine dehydratase [Deltaproteobacteria bacterium]
MDNERRFMRTKLLLGSEGYRQLTESSVVIVGLGAVGYTAAEALVRTGVGNITVVDCDIIEESDFNRHLLGTEENIGVSKVQAALKRLKSINSDVFVDVRERFFHTDTIPEIFDRRYDFLIDAIDSLNPKTELIKYCLNTNQPFISTMGAARRTRPDMVRISTISQGRICPLLRQIKRRLRSEGIYNDFPVVYSEEEVRGEVIKGEEMYYSRGRLRDVLPSSVIGTQIFGLYAASFAIDFLTENKRRFRT